MKAMKRCESPLGCAQLARHAVHAGGIYAGRDLCCDHMHDLMLSIGVDQPDFEEGFAKFKAQHRLTCGYEPDHRNEGVCDFCSPPKLARWEYDAKPFKVERRDFPLWVSDSGWLACEECSTLIEADDRDNLANSVLPQYVEAKRFIVDQFMQHRLGERKVFG